MKYLMVLVALYVGVAHSWDIATSSGDETLNFYTNEILTSTITIASRNLSALTYDEIHNIMLYVDKQTNNESICGYDLMSMENRCFTEGCGRNIYGVAFDPVTERIFFTDTNNRSVNWISLKPGTNYDVNVLVKVNDGIPRDVVVDSCKGYVYWLDTGLVRPTIERVRLDGTEREVFETLTTIPVNTTYTLEPNSLAIDQHQQKIYWMEPASTTEYHLFTRSLNTNHSSFHFVRVFAPKHIKVPSNTFTISKDSIFHLEYAYGINAVYSYSKIKSSETYYSNAINTVIEEKTVYSDKKMPISMVANYKIKDQIQNCEALNKVKLSADCDVPFCVHGTKVNGQSACKCTPGYTGERCDISVCENYCSQGNCSFTDEGLPKCRCNAGYTGERCHLSVCESYCLQGNCSFNSEGLPECRCNAGYTGERCHVSVCEGYCLQGSCSFNSAELPECRCNAGYIGERCHAFVCENYCLQGSCSLSSEGLPKCRCNAGYTGKRCEVKACEGYCLNSGKCSLNKAGGPSCECVAGYTGTRCETDKVTVTIRSNYNFYSPNNCLWFNHDKLRDYNNRSLRIFTSKSSMVDLKIQHNSASYSGLSSFALCV